MNIDSPLVSVIIPVFNGEKFIRDCLNSVVNQSYRNLEIIVVDDGSTDRTVQVISLIKDERVILIQQQNRGASFAKNVGLDSAKGDYIQYLDSDDILSLEKIEMQIINLKGGLNNVAVCKTIVFCGGIENLIGEIDTQIISEGGSGIGFLKLLLGSQGRNAMVQPNAYLIPFSIIEKAGPWLTDLYPCPDEDGEYFSRILLNTETVIFSNGINYYRRESNHKSLSKTFDEERVLNQLYSTKRKFDNLFEFEYSYITKWLFQLNISNVVYQFGVDYPHVVSVAKSILKQYGLVGFFIQVPAKFRIVSNFLGFENVLWFKRVIKILKSEFKKK